MIIADKKDVKLCVTDIETMAGLIDIGSYDPDENKWIEFEISEYQNDLYKFIAWYEKTGFDYMVAYNTISFDQQVLQWIMDNYQNWYDLSGLEICGKIYEYAQKVIENSRYDIPHTYTEHNFCVRPIDLFRIHHFDNKNRRTSLKWCAFMMNMNVEEMPIHHSKEHLTREEIEIVKSYRKNDVIVTLGLLYLTIGRPEMIEKLNGGYPVPELADYIGKNKIQDRMDVMNATGLDCINWSDVKIGEEWNKLDYKAKVSVKSDWDLVPKKVVQPYGKPFKKYFPSTVTFRAEKLKTFVKEFGEEFVKPKKQEFSIEFNKTKYTIAKGGIHSNEKYRAVLTPAGWITRDADVGSQYPWFIYKNAICPPHLKKEVFIGQVEGKIKGRIEDKYKADSLIKEGKKEAARPYMSLRDMKKLCLNGGLYGKYNQQGSWEEFPEGILYTTIGCQMEILMLIEMLEDEGISVISANTDGVVSQFPAEKEDKYVEICRKWEEIVGNTLLGKLEYADFSGLWQESVNSYIARKVDGSVKKKGRFVSVYGGPGCEINKNKSKRIIALALEEYFINKEDPIRFILNHREIMDFRIAKKTYGDLHFEEILQEGQSSIIHDKLVTYYVSNKGNVIKKRGKDANGEEMDNYCEAPSPKFPWLGEPLLRCFDKPFRVEKFEDYDIDYKFYILETLKRIDSIEKTNKAEKYAAAYKPSLQTSLF